MVYDGLSVPEGLTMTFADRLRELREAAGLTQEALADATGLSLGAVRNYEQGIREPYWSTIFKLADALGVSVEAFRECAGNRDEEQALKPPATPPKVYKPTRTAGTEGKMPRRGRSKGK
jgi:transcriptional regulator with XRE-family HTH domain